MNIRLVGEANDYVGKVYRISSLRTFQWIGRKALSSMQSYKLSLIGLHLIDYDSKDN